MTLKKIHANPVFENLIFCQSCQSHFYKMMLYCSDITVTRRNDIFSHIVVDLGTGGKR